MHQPVTVLAPLGGLVRPMADVPDPVFSAELVGPGLAIDPTRDGMVDVIAPIDGKILKLHAHAFIVMADPKHAVLVHLGLDTVQLGGVGFTLHVKEGDTVTAGDRVVSWDPAAIDEGGRSPVCPVVALEASATSLTPGATVGTEIRTGEPHFEWS